MCASRWPACAADCRWLATSWPATSPTVSITAKVIRYWMSDTANDQCGATKKKSNSATDSTAAHAAGARP
ncbi:hypothetical protein D3C78_1642830 [compost metagenome]